MKLLPICFGYPQHTTEVANFATFAHLADGQFTRQYDGADCPGTGHWRRTRTRIAFFQNCRPV